MSSYSLYNRTDVAFNKPIYCYNGRDSKELTQCDKLEKKLLISDHMNTWIIDLVSIYHPDILLCIKFGLPNLVELYIKISTSQDLENWTEVYKSKINTEVKIEELISIPLRYVSIEIETQFPIEDSCSKDIELVLKEMKVLVKNDSLKNSENLDCGNLTGFPFRRSEGHKKNICILGTSNSILRGYVNGLESLEFNVIKNVSIGSSHSSIIPYRIKELEGLDFEYLIIDIFVNENNAFNKGFEFKSDDQSYTTSHILAYLKYWCSVNNVIPIILIMPSNYANNEYFLNETIKWCIDCDLFYFNGFSFLERFCDLYGRPLVTTFNDPPHITMLMARVLGIVLNKALSDLDCVVIVDEPKDKIKIPFNDYNYLPLNKCKSPIITRKTSVVEEDFLILKKDEDLTIQLSKNLYITGLVINMAQTNCILEIYSNGQTYYKRLDNSYYNRRDLALVVWNFNNIINLSTENFKLSCRDFEDKNILKLAEDNDQRPNLFKDNPINLEISGLVVKSSIKHESEHIKISRKLDLMRGIEDSFLLNVFNGYSKPLV